MARFLGVYLFVSDVGATAAFYQALGLDVEQVSEMLGRVMLPDGQSIEFGTEALTRSYDSNWQVPGNLAKSTLGLEFDSREEVDRVYADILAAGYVGHLAPCDPPWGARFAIVLDPDGNQVGLHSPRARFDERQREQAAAAGDA